MLNKIICMIPILGISNQNTCSNIYMYAAAYGGITSPFVAVDSNGLENSYVWTPDGSAPGTSVENAGKATFRFSCSKSAAVTFKAEGSAPNGNADSFYIAVDGGDAKTWHYPKTNDWHWKTFSSQYSITEGRHELHVFGREDGIKLRRIGFEKGTGTCCFDKPDTGIHQIKPDLMVLD